MTNALDLVRITVFCAFTGIAPLWRQWTTGKSFLSFICDIAYFLAGVVAIAFGTVIIQGSIRRIRKHREKNVDFKCPAHQWDIGGGVIFFACGLVGSLTAFGLNVPLVAALPLTLLSAMWIVWLSSRKKLSCDSSRY
jgi:L-asparagine transporter-like permease